MSKLISYDHLLYLRKLKKEKFIIKISQISLFLFFCIAWEYLAYFKIIDPFLFSSPSKIIKAFVFMVAENSLFKHIGITLYETLLGFLISTLLGIFISIILWWNKLFQKIVYHFLLVFNSIPKTALSPIIIVWVGNNTKSVIATSVMTSLVVTIINIFTGFNEVNKEQLKLIQSFGGTKLQSLFYVVLPSNIPVIASTIKINIGLSFVGAIVGEFLVAQAGLGYLIIYGSQIFKMDWVMLSIFILALLSWLMFKITNLIEKKFNLY